jgi:hypothetical protein
LIYFLSSTNSTLSNGYNLRFGGSAFSSINGI